MFRPQEYEARLLGVSGSCRTPPSEVLGIRIGYFSSDERLRN